MFCTLLLSVILIFSSAIASAHLADDTRVTPARSVWRRTVSYIPENPANPPNNASPIARDGIPGVTGPNVESDIPANLLPNPPRARFIKEADYANGGAGAVPPSQSNPAVANAQPQSISK